MRETIFMGACLLLASGTLSASTAFTLYGTGFDNVGNLLTTAGSVDGNYTLTVNPDNGDPNAYLVDSTAYPLGPGGPWVADDSLSAWIGLVSGASVGVPGVYTYQESFDLTAYDPSTAQITGQLAADDSVEVFLNGVDTGSGTSAFNPLTPFTINSGFQSGSNTLTFVLVNQGTDPNPTGLRVEIDSATADLVPEPASFGFMGLGLAALGILGRRLRS
jgi:hypothetical protein